MSPSFMEPNFFIVGAPKCGTTALYTYLAEHPQVFMPYEKEPHFFADDFPGYQLTRDRQHYLDLFADASPEQVAIGEASVYYMASRQALERIHGAHPNARIIVMLRSPVDLAYSLFHEARFAFEDDVASFEQAWALQGKRAQGLEVPSTCREPNALQYGRVAMLGEQVARVQATFDAAQVHTIFFDDFVSDTPRAFARTLAFLGLRDEGRLEFPPVNVARAHRFPRLSALVVNQPRVVRLLKRSGLVPLVKKLGSSRSRREALSPRMRAMLADHFRQDVEHLAALTGRDLSSWLNPEARA